MWMQGGVDEEDRIDADAARHLLRRAARMLRPYRRQTLLALAMVVLWTATTLAGPLLVRYGIDRGIKVGDSGALNSAVAAYVGVAALSYVTYRFQVLLISRIGESFLRDLRVRVFDHLQRLSMPFYYREKAGVIV
jgi:ATP-binding cassette, subfamily B, bacterial